MAVAAAAALLDELMGRSRNEAEEKRRNVTVKWDDPEYCKFYLVSLCPHDLFINTKADLGPCHKIHCDEAKAQYNQSKNKATKRQFEDEFVRFSQGMLNDVERKIQKGEQRLALMGKKDAGANGDGRSPHIIKMEADVAILNEKIDAYVREAEKLGTHGNVEDAQDIMRKCDKLKEERERIKKRLDPNSWSSTVEIAVAQEKPMEVCRVCGAFLIIGDAQSRIEDHLMGKQHTGYGKLKAALDEIIRVRMMEKEERERQWEEENRRKERERSRRRSRSPRNGRSSKERSRHRSREGKEERHRGNERDRHRRAERTSSRERRDKDYHSSRRTERSRSRDRTRSLKDKSGRIRSEDSKRHDEKSHREKGHRDHRRKSRDRSRDGERGRDGKSRDRYRKDGEHRKEGEHRGDKDKVTSHHSKNGDHQSNNTDERENANSYEDASSNDLNCSIKSEENGVLTNGITSVTTDYDYQMEPGYASAYTHVDEISPGLMRRVN